MVAVQTWLLFVGCSSPLAPMKSGNVCLFLSRASDLVSTNVFQESAVTHTNTHNAETKDANSIFFLFCLIVVYGRLGCTSASNK